MGMKIFCSTGTLNYLETSKNSFEKLSLDSTCLTEYHESNYRSTGLAKQAGLLAVVPIRFLFGDD